MLIRKIFSPASLRIWTIIIFVLTLVVGIYLSRQKPIWNDEYYSLSSSIIRISWSDIWAGQIKEGNNSPLFYSVQKAWINLAHVQFPDEWLKGHWGQDTESHRLWLRMPSLICVALAAGMMFYVIASSSHVLWGIYGISIMMTTFILWSHWFEMRPYAMLWMFTVSQCAALLMLLRSQGQERRWWWVVGLVHVLLALTSAVSLIQILSAALTVWLFFQDHRRWFSLYLLLPVALCLYYFSQAPHYKFFYVDGPLALISANIPKERLIILVLAGLTMLIMFWQKKEIRQLPLAMMTFFIFTLMGFSLLLLRWLMLDDHKGFQLSNRYLIPLAPIAAMTFVWVHLWVMEWSLSKWWRWVIVLILGGCWIFRLLKTMTVL